MRFQIENIAKVKSARVNLNGLTVIAGENGSGKSTVHPDISLCCWQYAGNGGFFLLWS